MSRPGRNGRRRPGFIEDVLRFLDNVLTQFIENAPDGMERAKYSAMRERSVGLGIMGFHSFLQARGIPFESALAKSWNFKMFKQDPPRGRRSLGGAGRGARAVPGRA
jgi:ribonucleotide reductase alpha subunit